MQLWALPAHLPQWKRTVYGVHPRSALREEELGRVQRGSCLFVCSQSATIKNLYPAEKKKTFCLCALKPLFFSNSYHSAVFILICSSTQHPVAPTFSSPTLLCPSHPATWLLWQRYTKWRRGAQSWKAQSGSHFLTDPGLSTERVKTFYAWWIIKSTPWVFSGPVH